jgi:hypothetical protein
MGASTYSKPAVIQSKWFPEFEKTVPNLQGKTIAVTGTTSGTGFVLAKTCAKKGANVILLNRPSERSTSSAAAITAEAAPGAVITAIDCDLQSFDSVRNASKAVNDLCKTSGLDVLVNNAGVMALKDIATVDGYDVQMQTNHLSHFLLAKELFPLLELAASKRGEARIVHHSSGARFYPTNPLGASYFGKNGGNLGGNSASMFLGGARWIRYHQTKLANAVFTVELASKLKERGSSVIATCAAPGLAATNLQVTTNTDGGFGEAWMMKYFAQSQEDGTMPLLRAAVGKEAKNGDLWEPNGITGPPICVAPSKEKLIDVKARKLLWEESEKAVGEWKL